MTYREVRSRMIRTLQEAGIEEAEHESLLLLDHAVGMDRTAYLLREEEQVTYADQMRIMTATSLRASRCPLQYITGEQEFMGLPFKVNPDVLIPRPDTELLVEKVLACLRPGDEVLDLCTGSGCIGISIAHYRPDVHVTATDISRDALDTAVYNAKKNRCEVTFVQGDLFEGLDGRYDLIASNPPYIRKEEIPGLMEEVQSFEPRIALDGGEDGLDFYRRIVEDSTGYLKPGGTLVLEIGFDQAAETTALLDRNHFQNIIVYKDYNDTDRVVTARTGTGDWNDV